MIRQIPRFKTWWLLAALLVLARGGYTQDTGSADTLIVGEETSFVTGIGIVPVNFYNDQNLQLVEVTLSHDNAQVVIDSFSFAGSRISSNGFSRNVAVSDDSTLITVACISIGDSVVPAGRGLLGNIYYSYSQTITPQLIPIDTSTWFVGQILHSTSFRTAGGTSFVPQVVSGSLEILASPDSFDSVWVAQIEAVPGGHAAIDVFGYNERNLAKLSTALFYATADLILDSVSFVGTRCELAPSKTVQPQTSLFKVYTEVEFAVASPLPPGSGLLMTLHFTVAPEALEGFIKIDSTTVGIISNTRYWLTAADGGIILTPLFRAGGINVVISTGIDDLTDPDNLPTNYSLSQNYPNPFNPSTNIEFSLPEAGMVEIEVFNILGRRVRSLLSEELSAGTHRVVFDGRSEQGTVLATGVYFYRMSTETFQNTRKMILIK